MISRYLTKFSGAGSLVCLYSNSVILNQYMRTHSIRPVDFLSSYSLLVNLCSSSAQCNINLSH